MSEGDDVANTAKGKAKAVAEMPAYWEIIDEETGDSLGVEKDGLEGKATSESKSDSKSNIKKGKVENEAKAVDSAKSEGASYIKAGGMAKAMAEANHIPYKKKVKAGMAAGGAMGAKKKQKKKKNKKKGKKGKKKGKKTKKIRWRPQG